MHIASLRTRKTPLIETPEKLESLRQKQEEIQEKVQDFKIDYERKMEEIRYAQEQLERREVIHNLLSFFLHSQIY